MNEVKRRPRDAQSTRAAVLVAAEVIFAKHGYAGTSMRDVADTSGVSQPLIYHHFISKEGLYDAVLAKVMARFTNIPVAPEDWRDPKQAISHMLTRMIELVRKDTNLHRLISWSRLENSNRIWPGEEQLTHAVSESLKQAQAQGYLRADINAYWLNFIMRALTLYWLDDGEHFQKMLGTKVDGEAGFLHSAIEVCHAGMRAS